MDYQVLRLERASRLEQVSAWLEMFFSKDAQRVRALIHASGNCYYVLGLDECIVDRDTARLNLIFEVFNPVVPMHVREILYVDYRNRILEVSDCSINLEYGKGLAPKLEITL